MSMLERKSKGRGLLRSRNDVDMVRHQAKPEGP